MCGDEAFHLSTILVGTPQVLRIVVSVSYLVKKPHEIETSGQAHQQKEAHEPVELPFTHVADLIVRTHHENTDYFVYSPSCAPNRPLRYPSDTTSITGPNYIL